MNFSIIIPNYNGNQFLLDCLNSLFLSIKQIKNINFEIILIDNGSKDNSCQIFKDFFKENKLSFIQSRIYKLGSNHGFAGAVNKGINEAKYEWIILLNNDLTFEKNWFEKVLPIMKEDKDSKIATFFGTVLTKDGAKFESQGLDFFYSGKAQNISNGKKFTPSTIYDLKSKISVWGASAALVIYKKEIIKKIGLFDQDFFAYEEDVDIALRLHNLGYKTLYIPSAISYHLGGGTSNKMGNFRNRMDAKNWIYIIIKNFSSKEIIKNLPKIIEERLRNLSGLIKTTIISQKIKSIYLIPWFLIITYGEVIIKLPKMIKKRKQIQKLLLLDNI
jgi:hypothetical protein